MDVKSVMKKLKTPSFAAQVNREEIQDAISRTTLTLEEVIGFILIKQPAVVL
jgi:predicted hydrolase (HD superfamily)